MKKKRLMPMCLCLVLALGLAACDEIEDLLPSSGDDETSETSPTEPGDTGDDTEPTDPEGPSESVPTYSIEIVYPDGDISLEIGDSETIAVSLVTTVDNTDSRVAGTAGEVTLSSSDPSIVSIDGLTITALAVGEAVITAAWTGHGVTSSGLNVIVTAPVYTPTVEYSIAITSPSSGISVLTNSPITIGVSLITTVDGAPTSEEGSAETVELNISPDTSSVTINGLTITDTVAETVTITAKWIAQEVTSEPITITFVEPSAEAEITYGIDLTYPSADTVLYVGSELTVAATLYTYSDEAVSASEVATAENVTVTLDTSSTGSVDISGLTITGKTAGSVTLIVTWGEYATASVTFTVESVYTYRAIITAPTSETSIEVGETTNVVVLLYTTIDGVEQSPVTAGAGDISLTQTGEGAVSFEGLTVKGVTAGEVTITATWNGHEDVTIESVTITVTEPEQVFESYTYVITFYNSSNESFGTLPEDMELYAAGSFNGSGELQTDEEGNQWYDWGTDIVKLTDNNDGTFNLTLDILPRVGLDINIYAHDTSAVDPDTDMWEHYIAYHLITDDDLNNATGTTSLTYTLSLWSENYSSWEEVFYVEESGVTSCTVALKIQVTGGSDFETAYGDYNVYCQSDYDNWGGDNGVSGNGHKMTNNGDGTYTYKFDCEPYKGVDTYTLNVYPGNANGIDWDGSIFSSLTITIGSDDSGDISIGTDTLISTTSKTSWTDIFPVVENDPTTVNIHIGVKNTNQSGTGSSNNYYIRTGYPWVDGGTDSDFYYNDSDHAMTTDTTLSSVVSADKWYTRSEWDKTEDFEFTIYTATGSDYSYWNTYILPNSDISGESSNFGLWSYYAQDGNSNRWGMSLSYRSTDLVGVSDLYVVISFDFSQTSTTAINIMDISTSVTAGRVS